jgi:hypothetical protein
VPITECHGQALFSRVFDNPSKEDMQKLLQKLRGQQHVGLTPHSFYVRPECRVVELEPEVLSSHPARGPKVDRRLHLTDISSWLTGYFRLLAKRKWQLSYS